MTARPPRVRRWVLRLAIGMLPLLFFMAAHALWDYIEVRRAAAELERIAQKGEPLSYAVAVRPQGRELEDRDDAARYYLSAAILALKTAEIMNGYGQFGPVQSWLLGSAPQPDLAALVASTNSFISSSQSTYELLDKAAGLPFYVFPPGTEYNYQLAGLSNLTRVNAVRTLNAAAAGDSERAVLSAITGIRLRRALRADSFFVRDEPQRVPAVLSLTRPSDAALAALQQALEQETDQDTAADDLIRQRARYLDQVVRFVLRSNIAPGGSVDLVRTPIGAPSLLVAFPRPWLAHDVTNALREWSEMIEVARIPWPERNRAAGEILARPEAPPRRNLFLRPTYVTPIVYFRAAVSPDTLILDRAVRAAVGIERFRRAHEDALPPTLDALVPQYLQTVPADPFTGKPLRFRAAADAYVVYSVGRNGSDDGGVLAGPTGPTSSTRVPPPMDIGVRVLTRTR